MNICIKKGHDLKLAGNPAKIMETIKVGSLIKLHPSDFPGVKPKLLVKIDETLKKGQAVFTDKNNIDVLFTSPAAGSVEDIQFGKRKCIKSITIRVAENDEEVSFESYSLEKFRFALLRQLDTWDSFESTSNQFYST